MIAPPPPSAPMVSPTSSPIGMVNASTAPPEPAGPPAGHVVVERPASRAGQGTGRPPTGGAVGRPSGPWPTGKAVGESPDQCGGLDRSQVDARDAAPGTPHADHEHVVPLVPCDLHRPVFATDVRQCNRTRQRQRDDVSHARTILPAPTPVQMGDRVSASVCREG